LHKYLGVFLQSCGLLLDCPVVDCSRNGEKVRIAWKELWLYDLTEWYNVIKIDKKKLG